MGSVEKHRGAVDAKPICVWNAAFAGRQETLAVTPRKFPLCDTNSHTAVRTAALAALIRSAGLVAQNIVARELEAHLLLPGRSREAFQCVSYVIAMTPPRPRSRNVVLSDVVRGGVIGKVV